MVKQADKNGRPWAAEKPAKLDIRTVARVANVSIATVSRTINASPAVSEKLAQRVWQAIHERSTAKAVAE